MLLLSQDCSTLPLLRTLYCWVLSKEVSSTILKVFGMTRPAIEPKSPGPLTNTLPSLPKLCYNLENDIYRLIINSTFNPVGKKAHWLDLKSTVSSNDCISTRITNCSAKEFCWHPKIIGKYGDLSSSGYSNKFSSDTVFDQDDIITGILLQQIGLSPQRPDLKLGISLMLNEIWISLDFLMIPDLWFRGWCHMLLKPRFLQIVVR